MAVKIPLRQDLPHFSAQFELDGATYTFEFQWNFRSGAWFMSISDGDGAPIVNGVQVVVGWPLAKRIKDARMPLGTLQAQDTAGGDEDPGLTDLGARVQLYYFSQGEL